ncbi:sialidase family protein [Arenibacter sp. ARW7G5Y1]|uniref:sialidase family protein n=1 Tax=Arenibacter sp. ARW7G5Y1 TaxID=2135619 RepID=UPI000D7656F6|nr:sialidase family protein [Arenibacter sp. ARW7G5Y1]PXX21671.1 BNR repeat protein [Arenibacter sp. ARW7G5Y1]
MIRKTKKTDYIKGNRISLLLFMFVIFIVSCNLAEENQDKQQEKSNKNVAVKSLGKQQVKSGMKNLFSREELIEMDYPFGKYTNDIPLGDTDIEWERSNPDIQVFVPTGSGFYNGDNEHFLVFKAPKGEELLALWTQSSVEGRGDNHLVLARSSDAVNWSEPEYLVGAKYAKGGLQASWGFPIVSESGRIYIFYTREIEVFDNNRQGSGTMGCIFSDDNGYTWSEPKDVKMPRSKYDNPNVKYPKNWIVWQNPIKDIENKWIAGYTLITSESVKKSEKNWVNTDSRCYFMRFMNIDENPSPENIKIEWYPENDEGLEVKNPVYPQMSVAQEPATVLLPDGRLFTIMRNMTGFIYYSVSSDNGKTWDVPQMLRYSDTGEGIQHPMSPSPIYKLSNGKFVLIFHNNSGKRFGYDQADKEWDINVSNTVRNPTYYTEGEFKQDAKQPIWFGEPVEFLNTGDIAVPPKKSAEIGTYPSITEFKGKTILWYPDRKRYLLGKYLDFGE